MLVTIEKVLLLKQIPLFKTVSNMALSDLMSVAEEQTFRAGEILIPKGVKNNAAYFLLSGAVNVCEGENKKSVSAKTVLGLDSVFWIAPTLEQVVVAQKSVILKVSQERLYRMMALHPSLAAAILHGLSVLGHP